LALYRDELGWEEAWREGDTTVSLKLPGTDVQLMLDRTQAVVYAYETGLVRPRSEHC
jgi:hypothetical protein